MRPAPGRAAAQSEADLQIQNRARDRIHGAHKLCRGALAGAVGFFGFGGFPNKLLVPAEGHGARMSLALQHELATPQNLRRLNAEVVAGTGQRTDRIRERVDAFGDDDRPRSDRIQNDIREALLPLTQPLRRVGAQRIVHRVNRHRADEGVIR